MMWKHSVMKLKSAGFKVENKYMKLTNADDAIYNSKFTACGRVEVALRTPIYKTQEHRQKQQITKDWLFVHL